MKENVIEDGVKAVMVAALGGLFWCNVPMVAFAFFVAAIIAPTSNLVVQQYWPR